MTRLDRDHELAIERVLALTSDWAIGHVWQVERLAGGLFAALQPYHGLGSDEEILLRAGALLHDVGYPIDPALHHKISGRIVRTHLAQPFNRAQVELIALLARYHRKAMPKLAHRRYSALDERSRRLIEWLGGILRVADGLDRGHNSAVQWLGVSSAEAKIEIRVSWSDPAARPPSDLRAAGWRAGVSDELETDVVGAMRKRGLLERAIGLPIVVRAV